MADHTRVAPELQNLEIWHRYEPQLRELYLVKNLTLKKVKESMETQHGWPVFKLVTYEVVLRDELGLVKNLTKDDWHAIKHHVEKRSRNSRQSQVVLHGHVIEQKRITKAIGRYRRHVDISRVRSPILRNGLRIQTPPLSSPRTITPDDLAYIQMAVAARPSSSIKNAAPPHLSGGQVTISPRYRSGPLNIQAIMDIRTDSPFNHLAGLLKDVFSPHIASNQETTLTTSGFPQMVTSTITTHGLQQMHHINNQHQVVDIPKESSHNSMEQSAIFAGTDNHFELLMQACYVFSNNINDHEVKRRFLDWIGLVAEIELLKQFFRLKLPTVIAVWNQALYSSWALRHGKAFEILTQIGLEVDNGRLMQSCYTRYFAMAIDLGSNKAMGSVSRLLKVGVSPNTRFNDSTLPESLTEDRRNHYWRCCALKQSAKNRDFEMLEHLVTVCNFQCGKFDAMCGNPLISFVALSDPFTGRPPSLQCVKVLIKSGMRIDFLPKHSASSFRTIKSLGWHRYGNPELLVDRVFFWGGEATRDIHELIACKSQWAQECVTVSGVFMAAEEGPIKLRKYLDLLEKPEPAMKDVLLQVALTEAAHYGAIAVLECLLQFGVDPDVGTLMANLPEEAEEEVYWSPVGRAALGWQADALAILLDNGTDFKKYPLFKHVVRRWDDPVSASKLPMLEKRRSDTIQILLDAGAPIDVPKESLISAALIPLKPSIPYHLLLPKIVNEWTDHVASFEPSYALCDKLRQHGIDFDRGLAGCNTLQSVLREGCNFATVSYLINNGVQVHSIPQKNYSLYLGDWGVISYTEDTTMLHDALINSHVDRLEIFDILLTNGADVYTTTSKGMSILEASLYAARDDQRFMGWRPPKHQKESMGIFWKLFQLMGPRFAHSLKFKFNSLFAYLMISDESDDTICAGLDALEDLNSYEVILGRSLLMDAARTSRTALVMRLVERGCDINFRVDSLPQHKQGANPRFNTALEIAFWGTKDTSQKLPIVQFLLEKGAEVSAPPTKWGPQTALQSAVGFGLLGAVSKLLEKGADVNVKPGSQYSYSCVKPYWLPRMKIFLSVDIAARQGYLDIMHLLVRAGGLSGLPGVTGLDGAMVIAKERNHTGIVEYLQRHTGHQLTEEMCQAFHMLSSSASERTSSSFSSSGRRYAPSVSSEHTDGEHSCHCEPAALDLDADVIGESSNDIMEEFTAAQHCSVVLVSDQPGSSRPPQPLVTPNADLDAATANTHEASHSHLFFRGTDPADATQAENVPGDLDLEDLAKQVAVRGPTPDELMQCEMSLDQANGYDGEWPIQSNETGIGNEECMTPITRGILEWIQGADFGYNAD
ncbi:hypothetical protein PG999_000134 [Apiospora kogelbergensis]|uniref:Clr5 domain-containing protein n=1 Tax=Apiospora kogelbergensis TaxID=1337665 RepID=A0AAW0RB15_9PEZI